jgi:hypothetical protein
MWMVLLLVVLATNTPWGSDHSESNPQQSAVHTITAIPVL